MFELKLVKSIKAWACGSVQFINLVELSLISSLNLSSKSSFWAWDPTQVHYQAYLVWTNGPNSQLLKVAWVRYVFNYQIYYQAHKWA